MNQQFPEVWGLIGALFISLVSGFVSISQRILRGHPATILWIISEFATATLCGYLAYSAYPFLQENFPAWFTLPVAVAISAHLGGRVFQEMESWLIDKATVLLSRK